MSQRPFAAFDIDGTLIRWQLYHAVADTLAHKGYLDPPAYERAKDARMTWKRRSNDASFEAYEHALIEAYNSAITNIPVAEAKAAYTSVLSIYKDQVYTYTRDLITDLKSKNYLLFAISASQDDIVKLLAEYYGFDDYGGSVYKIKDDKFTGELDVLRSERKPEFLKELVVKHNATWEDSYAVGDSESDIPMLSIVQKPIAFNPSRMLFEHATKQGWKVVVERKNVVYKLENRNGKHTLT